MGDRRVSNLGSALLRDRVYHVEDLGRLPTMYKTVLRNSLRFSITEWLRPPSHPRAEML